MTEATILDRVFIIKDDNIYLKLENQLLVDQFNKVKGEIVEFLRNQLNNKKLTIHAEIVEMAEQKASLFSNSDKFKFLAEKYPILEDLRKKLGLEFDY